MYISAFDIKEVLNIHQIGKSTANAIIMIMRDIKDTAISLRFRLLNRFFSYVSY